MSHCFAITLRLEFRSYIQSLLQRMQKLALGTHQEFFQIAFDHKERTILISEITFSLCFQGTVKPRIAQLF